MNLNCFVCGSADHLYADCPSKPAARGTWADHLAAVHNAVEAWQNGAISIEVKRRTISDENVRWYGPACRSSLRWPPRGS